MAHISRYIVKSSKTGALSYRRRIPTDVIGVYGKREEKQSLKTKSMAAALLAAARINHGVELAIKAARLLSSTIDNELQTSELAIEANRQAIHWGVHPDQAPVLKAGHTEAEREAFFEEEKEWLARRHHFLELVTDNLTDYEKLQKDYETGLWGQKGYANPIRTDSQAELELSKIAVVEGSLKTSLEPTLLDALNVYLDIALSERDTNQLKQKRFKLSKQRAVNEFASFIGKGDRERGLKTKLVDVSRVDARAFYRASLSKGKASTVGRKYGDLQAIFNKALNEFELSGIKSDPFAGIRNKNRERKSADERRSFKPEELAIYTSLVLKCNEQLMIIGLLMIEVGMRLEEASGLVVEDLDLKSNIPHIKIRTNSIRGLDKDSLERSNPLNGQALAALQSYEIPTDLKAPLFPHYGTPQGPTNASASLRGIIRRKMGITDRSLTPYSTRHTFADRCRAARVDDTERLVLMGHKGKFSTPIADRYGTGIPPVFLLNAMNAQLSVVDWGNFDKLKS